MSTPGPRPGPAGPDLDALRHEVADLLDASAPESALGSQERPASVSDAQVEALDRAHTLLSEALESLDRGN